MNISNGPGRPSELTDEVKARVLDAVSKVIIPSQVAGLARLPKQTLLNWLHRGEDESKNGIDSQYAQFWCDFKEAQALVLWRHLSLLEFCPKNYGALTWILEKCFRDDFGPESEEMKQIKEMVFNQILPLIGKGEARGQDRKEVDTEGGR